MSDTPRTDEFLAGLSINEYEFGEVCRYARTLERDLREARLLAWLDFHARTATTMFTLPAQTERAATDGFASP